MPAKTRVFRFDAGESGPSARSPASLGGWIRDVPPVLSAGRSNWICVAVSDAHHLLCGGTQDGAVYVYDFAAGRWVDPVDAHSEEDSEGTLHPAVEDVVEEIFCTRDYLIAAGDGLYYIYSLPSLRLQDVLKFEMAIPAEEAGEYYKNMIFTDPADGTLGIDLISVPSREIRRQYRFPPDQPEPHNYIIKRFDYNHELVIATVIPPHESYQRGGRDSPVQPFTGTYPEEVRRLFTEKERELDGGRDPVYQLAWNLESGRLVHRRNLIPPYGREDCWGPFLNEHYLHFANVLVEVPAFRPVHTFEVDDILGIAGDKVVAATSEPDQDVVLEIYWLPGFQKEGEVTIEGYRWVRGLHSRKYFLLEKKGDRRDFILVNLEDFCTKF